MPDLYEILGVSVDASTDEIKQAFRRKAFESHPDTTDNPGRVKEFRKLVNAYEVCFKSSPGYSARHSYMQDKYKRMPSAGTSRFGKTQRVRQTAS